VNNFVVNKHEGSASRKTATSTRMSTRQDRKSRINVKAAKLKTPCITYTKAVTKAVTFDVPKFTSS
jgi:hypothetical protein